MLEQIQLTPEDQLTPEEKQMIKVRVELIMRAKRFTEWLNLGKRQIATNRTVAYIQEYLPPPHFLDEYEMKRAIEEGLM